MEAVIIEAEVIEALRSCFDPEIPVNIYELGLIYVGRRRLGPSLGTVQDVRSG